MSPAARFALAPVRLYQRVISPLLPRRCKYHPTCSAYGNAGGRALRHTARRRAGRVAMLRCNPFSHGGYDPVSADVSESAAALRHTPALHALLRRESTPAADRLLRGILMFFHDLGLGWGLAIIALTCYPDPAAAADAQAVQSMQSMAQLQPEIKKLQDEVQERQGAPQPGDDEVLPGEQGQPVRLVPADGGAAPGLPVAVLHAARGPRATTSARRSTPRHGRTRCPAATAATRSSSSSRI